MNILPEPTGATEPRKRRYDLQTLTFWQLKNAPKIPDFETFTKAILPRPLRSLVTPNYQIFEDPPINDYQVKGAVFDASLDQGEKDNIYMLYEGRHNSLPRVVSSQGQTAEYV